MRVKPNLENYENMCKNSEPIRWSVRVFGLPFQDNWWQTEGGGILTANYPCMPIKSGSMGKPFPGIKAVIVEGLVEHINPGGVLTHPLGFFRGRMLVQEAWIT